MSTIGDELRKMILDSGGSFRATGKVDLLTVKRALLGWVSPSIQMKIGVEGKPKPGSLCPLCQKQKDKFELDHQGPWRVYVAATGGGNITLGPKGEMLIDRATLKALYNDPENLWWICHDCNSKKSDMVYDEAAQLQAIASGVVPDAKKGVDPSDVY